VTQLRMRVETLDLGQKLGEHDSWGRMSIRASCCSRLCRSHLQSTRADPARHTSTRAGRTRSPGGKASSRFSGTQIRRLVHTRLDAWRSFNRTCQTARCSCLRSNHAELMFMCPLSQDGEPVIYRHFKFLTCLNDQGWRGF
jgi:hypothetical protein